MKEIQTPMPNGSEDELQRVLTLARDFATSDAEKSEAAWQSLNSYSRSDLVKKLVQIQAGSATDEPDRLAIAFLLCHLNVDYETNKKLIVAAFEREPHPGNPYADWEAGLLARLLQDGDNKLLTTLFSAASWSDGALSTDLSGIYLASWRSDPKAFLVGLKLVSLTVKRQVYFLLFNDELITAEDTTNMRAYLQSASHDPTVGLSAKEMLEAMNQIEKRRRQNTK